MDALQAYSEQSNIPTPASKKEILQQPKPILCTEEEIHTMLKSLDTSKANGLDDISDRMLYIFHRPINHQTF